MTGISEYLDGIPADFEQASHGGSIAQAFHGLSAKAREAIAEDADPVEDPPSPLFLHLNGARTFSPGGHPIPTNRGVWWRGRLDSIDAWSFGELRAES